MNMPKNCNFTGIPLKQKQNKMKKNIQKIVNYDKIYQNCLIHKRGALMYWLEKKVKEGSDQEYLTTLIFKKMQSLNEEIYTGYNIYIKWESAHSHITPNIFLQRLYDEFERREKLAHKNFITDTLEKLPEIQYETGNSEVLNKTKLIRNYAYFRTYKIFVDNLTNYLKKLKAELLKGDKFQTRLPKKEYKSLTRARAFCIMEMSKNGKVSKDVMESKNKIIEFAENMFPKKSGDTVHSGLTIYQALKSEECLYLNIEKLKIKYPLDYNYGLKLYKEKYPD